MFPICIGFEFDSSARNTFREDFEKFVWESARALQRIIHTNITLAGYKLLSIRLAKRWEGIEALWENRQVFIFDLFSGQVDR